MSEYPEPYCAPQPPERPFLEGRKGRMRLGVASGTTAPIAFPRMPRQRKRPVPRMGCPPILEYGSGEGLRDEEQGPVVAEEGRKGKP